MMMVSPEVILNRVSGKEREMISYGALDQLEKTGHLVKVLENKEADLYYAEEDMESWGYNYNVELKKGEYIAVSREVKMDVWTDDYFNSTKGSYKRCEKAWEKYSPETMAWMRKAAGIA